jgi:hypothetical protein
MVDKKEANKKEKKETDEKEVVKGVWHNGLIKKTQIKASTEKAHLITAKDDSEYLLWLPVKWFRDRKGHKDELSVGFLESGEYTMFKTEEGEDGFPVRGDDKTVDWREAFDRFALPLPKLVKTKE